MNPFLQLHPAFPECLLLSGLVAIILIDLFLKGKKCLSVILAEILLLLVFVCILCEHKLPVQFAFQGHYVFDRFGLFVKGCAVAYTFLLLAYAEARNEFQALRSEYLFLILLGLLGAMVLASSASLISMYLGLELLSLPVYALVALKRDCPKAGEAAIKYFITGALASGFLLYGFSLIYGITGSLWLPQIAGTLYNTGLLSTPVFWLAAIFIFVAISFKFGIFPFHMWVPDVYEGAPLSVTAFIATVTKLAAFALFFRLFILSFIGMPVPLSHAFFWMGALSLVLGSTGALLQKNIRRFLGYSTIANMGILFIALGLASAQGYISALFYLVAYTAGSLAIFGLLLLFNQDLLHIDDLKGLHKTKPFTAFLFLLVMLSFAGIPPLVGFDGKLLVMMALVHQNHIALAVFILVLSVISAAYALRLVKAVYFERGSGENHFPKKLSFGTVLVSLNVFVLLGFGLFPAPLILGIQRLFM